MAWGDNQAGQCNVPEPNTGFVAVASGGWYGLGLKADSSIVAWGSCGVGQCDVPAPNTGFVAVAGGFSHGLGLKADGSIVAWGLNADGQCDVPEPNTGFVAVAGGADHSLGLKADGSIVAWGDNYYRQCDVPAPNMGFVAVAVAPFQNVGVRRQLLFVDGDATGPTHDGSSWCSAYLTLQDTLSAVTPPAIIRVANGTYAPDQGGGQTPGDRTATFQLIDGVTIEGGYAGCGATDPDERDIELYETILSGDLTGDDSLVSCTQDSPDCDSYGGRCMDGCCIISQNNAENSHHVVTSDETDSTAIVDGFTMTAGNAQGDTTESKRGAGVYNPTGNPTLINCTFSKNSAMIFGGGIYNGNHTAPILTNCTFLQNVVTVGTGAGMFNDLWSNPALTNCGFIENTAAGEGGAMHNQFSNPALINCQFLRNTGTAGAIYNEGSEPTLYNCAFIGNSHRGVSNHDGSCPTFINCTFSANVGGGMLNYDSDPALINCIFTGNFASGNGGAMHNSYSDPTLINCTFSGNSADRAGAIYNRASSSPALTNCTFSGNVAYDAGGGIYNWDSSPTVANSVFWGNVDDADSSSGGPFTDESAQIHTESGTPTVNYSLLQGGWSGAGGTGVVSDNPLCVRDPDDGGDGWGDDSATPGIDEGANDDYGDLRLLPGSPCIDAADTTAVPADLADLDDDGDTSERTPYDLDGIPRVIDDPDTVDTGVSGSPVVDMGAYEYYADCNRNGLPDVCDLDCDALSGTCDLPGCGESVDVDPADGIPDECVEFTGGCDPDIDWSCCDNWNIPGEVYPDNTETESFSPVLDGPDDDVFLDVTVEIDTLDILNGATLSVTQDGAGDLTVVEPGGILAEGTIYVDYDRVISIPNGPLVISGDAGRYEAADPSASGTVSASLIAQQVRLLPIAGGRTHQMTLTDSMSVTTTGDFIMEAVGDDLIGCVVPGGRQLDSRGGRTPPITRMSDSAFMSVGANLSLLGAVSFINDSTVPVIIGGDIRNESTAPQCFDCLNGLISLTGTEPQAFEVAGEDLGQAATFADTEFAIGTLEVAAGTAITFADSFDNDEQGQGTCTEALYVHDLILRTGSTIVLDNCRIYYENLTEEANVTKTFEGCSALLSYCPTSGQPEPERLDLEFDPESRKIRYASFQAGEAGQAQAVRVAFNNVPSPYDTWNGVQLYVQQPHVYCENAGVSQPIPPATECPMAAGGLPQNWFWGAGLGCDPHWTDWTAYDVVHVFNEGIIPGGEYDIQVIDSTCSLDVDDNYSDALTMTQSAWADLIQDCTTTPCKPPDGSTGIVDVTAILDKWKNLPGNVKKVRADIEGSPGGDHRLPDQAINITDVTYCLGAFLGDTYPGPGFPLPSDPPDCP